MTLNRANVQRCLKEFDFKRLFLEELGWDDHRGVIDVQVDGHEMRLTAVADKRGMTVFLCDGIHDYATRRKIETQVAKHVYEHLVIHTDADKTRQIWQWVKREEKKPKACREHCYHKSQSGESLIQKLERISFSLEEEAKLDVTIVAERAREGFDLERVTKKFYDEFKKQHATFLKFLRGIPDEEMERWYVSVMLNRLMFIYFIQQKGFLDNDKGYLQTQLAASRMKGKDLYYKNFLCPLFFEGFAKPESERSEAVKARLGRIPYLNGGIFQQHQIERLHGKTIEIPDKAFEAIFAFFEQYQWHLDERPLKDDREINPDVLGYIFEKYINQKQMGAYYTKEDITGYISRNTIIPRILDMAREKCRIAFDSSAENSAKAERHPTVWNLLQQDPDRYIYPAVQKGIAQPLPAEVAKGCKDAKQRGKWNEPADEAVALPTETWREVVVRRERYEDVRDKLARGEVRCADDLITCNLDITQFAQDVVENAEGPELLRATWQAIEKVTVLDPTCGSGAFLFAAINILEPLYEACLDRMQGFLDEMAHSGQKHHPDKFKDFKEILDRVNGHPSPRYFIFKTIILNNIFGVDIMEEAVEICKLRLFLKLVAQVEDVEQIEPLPDIDFNIRSGNTLVGFPSMAAVEKTLRGGLGFARQEVARLREQAEVADKAYEMFRRMQAKHDMPPAKFAEAKELVRGKLSSLESDLNAYLAGDYGIDVGRKKDFAAWTDRHKPFHWFVDFYGVLKNGGFDVIIGNPPYVETKNIDYVVRGFQTTPCGDLYALCMERSLSLLASTGQLGMIIPVSVVSADGFAELRQVLRKSGSQSWTLSFAERPSKLFTGVEKRLTIWLLKHGTSGEQRLYLSNYKRWAADERATLFSRNQFVPHNAKCSLVVDSIPKVCSDAETRILERLADNRPLTTYLRRESKHVVYYTRKLRYFVQFFDFVPLIKDSNGKRLEPSELKDLYLDDQSQKEVAISLLNSSLFFWFFCAFSDVRNVNRREIGAFRCSLDKMRPAVVGELRRLSGTLMKDFAGNSRMLTADYGSHGVLSIQSFQPRRSKTLIDEIDRVLAIHYGFSDRELDFILNYDYKYRMGKDSGESDEE